MLEKFEIVGEVVYKVTYEDDKEVARCIHSCTKKVILSGSGDGSVGVTHPVLAQYTDWEGNPLSAENTTILVTVTKDQEQVGTIDLQPVNGVVELDLDFTTTGKYQIKAVGVGITNTPGELVVNVQ